MYADPKATTTTVHRGLVLAIYKPLTVDRLYGEPTFIVVEHPENFRKTMDAGALKANIILYTLQMDDRDIDFGISQIGADHYGGNRH